MVSRARTAGPVLRIVPGGAAPTPERAEGLDDGEILEACRRGDASAARALHTRVRPIVDATIARLLGRKDARAEDLAQIAIVEVVRSLARFRGECSLDTWTSRIAAHAVYKELRRRKIEHRIFADAAAAEEAPCSEDGIGAAEARSTLRRVREHLAEIDPVKAWTLLLHDVAGYDLKEIAEITGASMAAAQTRLVRGRAALQARLEADPELAAILRERRRR